LIKCVWKDSGVLLLFFICSSVAQAASGTGLGFTGQGYDPTDDLIGAFGAQCRSIDQYTMQALSQSTALMNIVESMKNDTSCDSIRTALMNSQNAGQQVASLLAPKVASDTSAETDRQLGQLLAAYQAETDTTLKSDMATNLASLQVQSIMLKGGAESQRRQLLYSGMGQLATYNDNLFSALNAGTECLQKRPGLVLQIAAQALSMSSNFVSMPLSPAVLGAGLIIDHLVTYLKNYKFQKVLTHINNARIGIAVGCAMESIASTYCEARDAENLISSYRPIKGTDPLATADWAGYRILNRDMGQFTSWVERIAAGSPATNTAQTDAKSQGDLLDAGLRIAKQRLPSVVQTGKVKLANLTSTDPTQLKALQIIVLRGVIKDLISGISAFVLSSNSSYSSSSSSGLISFSPFYNLFLFDLVCGPQTYLYEGTLVAQPAALIQQGSCSKTYLDTEVPAIKDIEARVKNLLVQASASVASEVRLYRENDPFDVLAKSELEGPALGSAQTIIQRMLDYLNGLEGQYPNLIPPDTHDMIEDTKTRLGNSSVKLAKVGLQEGGKQDLVAAIRDQLAPEQDEFYIANRFRDVVNWELSQKVKNGTLESVISNIIQLSTSDQVGALDTTGSVDLDHMQQTDIPTAQSLTIGNLESVDAIFGGTLNDHFESLEKEFKKLNAASLSRSITLLCMQATVLPDGLKSKMALARYCQGRKMVSNITAPRSQARLANGPPIELSFDDVMSKPFDERVCKYYDFQRKSRLASLKK